MTRTLNRYYRILATGFCFSIFGIGALSLVTIIFPIITFIKPSSRMRSLAIRTAIKISFKIFVWLMIITRLISVKVMNSEALKNIKGTVIVANHPSLIDIVILISILPQTDCIVKKSLGNNFFVKNVIKSAYILASDDIENLFSDCEKSLSQGNNLIIFPEGTRTVPGKKSKLSRGAAQIAIRTKAPILPISISCTPPGLLKNQKWYDVADTELAFVFEAKPVLDISQYVNTKRDHIIANEITKSISEILLIN